MYSIENKQDIFSCFYLWYKIRA